MKFTNEDLAKAMGLKVGDRIAIKVDKDEEICIVNDNLVLRRDLYNVPYKLAYLLNKEFEIIQPKKRLGDMRCNDFFKICNYCPLNFVCSSLEFDITDTFYKDIEKIKEKDKELYDVYKKRLDKEVD